MTNYETLGAFSQHFSDAPEPAFSSVGTMSVPLDSGTGIASNGTDLFFVWHDSIGTQIRWTPVPPDPRGFHYQSPRADTLNHPERALAMMSMDPSGSIVHVSSMTTVTRSAGMVVLGWRSQTA